MIKGIDVSVYQGVIDWNKVKASGVEVVIIRAGYGQNNVDARFKENIEGAIRAGLRVGVYWFLYGTNEVDITNNAHKCYQTCQPYLDYITERFWCDWEYDSDNYSIKQGVTQSKNSRTALVKLFCETLKVLGVDVGVYANPDYLKTKFNDLKKYPLWLAGYGFSKIPSGFEYCVMWQYSSTGRVDGIKGNVDMNNVYDDAPEVIVKAPVVEVSNMPVIRRGSNGKAVKVWQVIVDAEPDGIFGQETERLTKKFQTEKNIGVDGIVGNESWNTGLNTLV